MSLSQYEYFSIFSLFGLILVSLVVSFGCAKQPESDSDGRNLELGERRGSATASDDMKSGTNNDKNQVTNGNGGGSGVKSALKPSSPKPVRSVGSTSPSHSPGGSLRRANSGGSISGANDSSSTDRPKRLGARPGRMHVPKAKGPRSPRRVRFGTVSNNAVNEFDRDDQEIAVMYPKCVRCDTYLERRIVVIDGDQYHRKCAQRELEYRRYVWCLKLDKVIRRRLAPVITDVGKHIRSGARNAASLSTMTGAAQQAAESHWSFLERVHDRVKLELTQALKMMHDFRNVLRQSPADDRRLRQMRRRDREAGWDQRSSIHDAWQSRLAEAHRSIVNQVGIMNTRLKQLQETDWLKTLVSDDDAASLSGSAVGSVRGRSGRSTPGGAGGGSGSGAPSLRGSTRRSFAHRPGDGSESGGGGGGGGSTRESMLRASLRVSRRLHNRTAKYTMDLDDFLADLRAMDADIRSSINACAPGQRQELTMSKNEVAPSSARSNGSLSRRSAHAAGASVAAASASSSGASHDSGAPLASGSRRSSAVRVSSASTSGGAALSTTLGVPSSTSSGTSGARATTHRSPRRSPATSPRNSMRATSASSVAGASLRGSPSTGRNVASDTLNVPTGGGGSGSSAGGSLRRHHQHSHHGHHKGGSASGAGGSSTESNRPPREQLPPSNQVLQQQLEQHHQLPPPEVVQASVPALEIALADVSSGSSELDSEGSIPFFDALDEESAFTQTPSTSNSDADQNTCPQCGQWIEESYLVLHDQRYHRDCLLGDMESDGGSDDSGDDEKKAEDA